MQPFDLQEYNEILAKRTQQLQNIRHQPAQFTVLVREIPLCSEHKTSGCSVDHFFSKHYPYAYHSYQMLYDATDLEQLLELPVAFVTFKSRWGAALAAQSQQHPHPLLWITEMAPEPRDVLWKNLATSYRYLPLQNLLVFIAASLLTIFFAIPVTAVQGIAKFEKLRKWFPPAMALQLMCFNFQWYIFFEPSTQDVLSVFRGKCLHNYHNLKPQSYQELRSVVTGYLPSAVLKGFIYIVPFAMLGMAKLAGCVSGSKQEIKCCSMVFYFLVGNVFFLSLLSGSLLDEIGESFSNPKNFPSHLASAVSAQADFFMTYILTDGLSGFSLEVLQPGLLIWDFIKSHTYSRGKEKVPYLYSMPYFRVIPFVSLSILIGMVYAVVAPLLLPFLIGYFFFGYAVYVNQVYTLNFVLSNENVAQDFFYSIIVVNAYY
ncbi:CSC1-like protein [Vitis vinifera]|uniref:CSC1-like protein n=1 Tax=Vitis vinifera TaxID=29760 RepID=A0A438CY09_VITVI|nr:CSC1-like protein [Vitis vinifera]